MDVLQDSAFFHRRFSNIYLKHHTKALIYFVVIYKNHQSEHVMLAYIEILKGKHGQSVIVIFHIVIFVFCFIWHFNNFLNVLLRIECTKIHPSYLIPLSR